MSPTEFQLVDCAREPIHVPGGIQPNGALLACDGELVVMQAGANLAAYTGISASEARGCTLATLLGAAAEETVLRARAEGLLDLPLVIELDLLRRPLLALVHRHEGATIVELEDRGAPGPALAALSGTLARIQKEASLSELLPTVAREMRAVTGFDRVLVYRFLDDDSGHVVAESRIDALAPYLGLRYPASDIPAQARRLYLLNPLRLIPAPGCSASGRG